MENKEIRRKNFQMLCDQHGRDVIAKKMKYSDTVYINQLYGGHAPCGDRTARKIETSLKLPTGWMDEQHDKDDPEITAYIEELKEIMKSSPPSARKKILSFAKFVHSEQESEHNQ
ncbi:hypothetical protein TDB9533_01251 [Thalassocella blandensis]|nr:hypothetical protein TDB9533_01251 [Thalassocella blandensis]